MGLKNTIITVLIFSIILNLATGAIAKLPAFEGYDMGGLTYSEDYNKGWQEATEGANKTIPLAGDEVATTGAFNSVQDFLTLKSYVRFFAVIDNYMFGFVNILSAIFRGPLDSAGTGLGTWLFNGLKSLLSLGYIFLMFYLYTGRDIEGKK